MQQPPSSITLEHPSLLLLNILSPPPPCHKPRTCHHSCTTRPSPHLKTDRSPQLVQLHLVKDCQECRVRFQYLFLLKDKVSRISEQGPSHPERTTSSTIEVVGFLPLVLMSIKESFCNAYGRAFSVEAMRCPLADWPQSYCPTGHSIDNSCP